MRKLAFTLLLLSIVAGCEDPAGPSEESIVGAWRQVGEETGVDFMGGGTLARYIHAGGDTVHYGRGEWSVEGATLRLWFRVYPVGQAARMEATDFVYDVRRDTLELEYREVDRSLFMVREPVDE